MRPKLGCSQVSLYSIGALLSHFLCRVARVSPVPSLTWSEGLIEREDVSPHHHPDGVEDGGSHVEMR